jgi:cobalt-precorrin 5A hydrolase
MNTVKPESSRFLPDPGRRAAGEAAGGDAAGNLLYQRALLEEGFVPFDGGFAPAVREAFSTTRR